LKKYLVFLLFENVGILCSFQDPKWLDATNSTKAADLWHSRTSSCLEACLWFACTCYDLMSLCCTSEISLENGNTFPVIKQIHVTT